MPNISTFAAQGSYNNLLKNRQICTNTDRGPFVKIFISEINKGGYRNYPIYSDGLK